MESWRLGSVPHVNISGETGRFPKFLPHTQEGNDQVGIMEMQRTLDSNKNHPHLFFLMAISTITIHMPWTISIITNHMSWTIISTITIHMPWTISIITNHMSWTIISTITIHMPWTISIITNHMSWTIISTITIHMPWTISKTTVPAVRDILNSPFRVATAYIFGANRTKPTELQHFYYRQLYILLYYKISFPMDTLFAAYGRIVKCCGCSDITERVNSKNPEGLHIPMDEDYR
ncbi:hypothetical protein STEG23_007243 [Scotinomys teguina]